MKKPAGYSDWLGYLLFFIRTVVHNVNGVPLVAGSGGRDRWVVREGRVFSGLSS